MDKNINPSKVVSFLPAEMFGLMNNIKPLIGLGVNQTLLISELIEKGEFEWSGILNINEIEFIK